MCKFGKYNFHFSCSLTELDKTPHLGLHTLLAVAAGVELKGGIQLQTTDTCTSALNYRRSVPVPTLGS